MSKSVFLLLLISISTFSENLCAQKIFHKIDLGDNAGGITGIIQDRLGYIWFAAQGKGLIKYDGSRFIAYTHNENDTNSIAGILLEALALDSSGNIWIGTNGNGMDMLDPSTSIFRHFRHRANDPGSISHDTVDAILEDHLGNLWIGTVRGLDRYDRNTGKFIHYTHNDNDANSLSGTHVRVLYEDREGNLWVGCGSPFPNEESWKDEGGLNRFDRTTGKFTRYLHNSDDPASIANNKVRALLEDSKGNFWVGTAGDGLQTLNRKTGKFIHYYYDSTHPHNLSRGVVDTTSIDQVQFIKEDIKGKVWIGVLHQGIFEYDLQTKKTTHHGYIVIGQKLITADTLTGFNDNSAWSALTTKDGLTWIGTLFSAGLYKIDFNKNVFLTYEKSPSANAFYKSADGTLWIATGNGMVRKDGKTGNQRIFVHDSNNSNSLSNNVVTDIKPDWGGNLWIGTLGGGLDEFNLVTNQFTHINTNVHSATGRDSIGILYPDVAGNLWIGTVTAGLIKRDKTTGKLFHFMHDSNDTNSVAGNGIISITGNKKNLWVSTQAGLDKLEMASGKLTHYLHGIQASGVVIDGKGIVWAGTSNGLYEYDTGKNSFILFNDPAVQIGRVISLNADKNDNIWISSGTSIFLLKSDRKHIIMYANNNLHAAGWISNNDYISEDGEVFVGDVTGYYRFYADSVQQEVYAPQLNFASLQIGGAEVKSGSGILNKALSITEELKIPDNKNSFSIAFSAIDYRTSGEKKVVYMLENYDNQWHQTASDQTAYFYNLPVGHYTLRARAVNAQGAWMEKSLSIIVTPPWWQTWWAITILVVVFIGVIVGFSYYRSYSLQKENKVLEEKVKHRTTQLQRSLEELRTTQTQLIQSEKMASLGELTAGIAHEIQNPLNFVNNFSEVNGELINELVDEVDRGNLDEVRLIAVSLKDNEKKIMHHGKRADAIVKGMLQHSRTSTSQKERTDINALCDEYLRLSYHGMRAKEKNFNATLHTDFDSSIGKINIIPQDIGRVLLNLINNAFYAVSQKLATHSSQLAAGNGNYVPSVTIVTKKLDDKIEISVKDNGPGIPQNIVDKIFQPFFTTKPTGQGTGLGLSLSYDIIKAHGGEMSAGSGAKAETKEGEGSEFIIVLPA
ncbi:MAG TPA: two-component regulator propeller domain-containing protein [Parafilimonas sp.]|nr:two-component regulator propeller domain-containing protein [Parafilimonas sp.]